MRRAILEVAVVVMVVGVASSKVVVPEAEKGALWAVLVAGSNTWMNYRHQADMCHAYQILHDHGVPDDHIIVFMYDDIAHNPDNPKPGVIINRPNGTNVYKGVPKDYTGAAVTPDNFLKVLQGDSQSMEGVGSGKVVKSGPRDRVFLYMVDHGAPGLFAFPHSILHVTQFMSVIKHMHRNKHFHQMVIYMESCESGSMFKTLPDDINVYALSASNASQPSYACYYDKSLDTFLGDVFSVKWMEDVDRENVRKETLRKQFSIVEKETKTSSVTQWGEVSLGNMKVSEFVGGDKNAIKPTDIYGPYDAISDPCLHSSVANPDVPLAVLLHSKDNTKDLIGQDFWTGQINQMQTNRTFVQTKMAEIVKMVTGAEAITEDMMNDKHHEINDYQCHQDATTAWHDICFDLAKNPYALRLVHVIVNLCEHGYSAKEFTAAARTLCTHQPVSGIQ